MGENLKHESVEIESNECIYQESLINIAKGMRSLGVELQKCKVDNERSIDHSKYNKHKEEN